MLQVKIAEIINNEMGYTNGWRISDDEYKQLCLKVAGLVIKEATEQGVAADQKRFDCSCGNTFFDVEKGFGCACGNVFGG